MSPVIAATMVDMRTVLVGEPPPEFQNLLERRRALGQDLFDEVWEGEYHVAPGPSGQHGHVDHQLARILGTRADAAGLRGSGRCNIGKPDNYRVPDQAFFPDATFRTFYPSADLVVEIVSPGDESREKFGFYFNAGVKEVLIADPDARTVEWFTRTDSGFRPAAGSDLLDVSAAELAEAIEWPRSS